MKWRNEGSFLEIGSGAVEHHAVVGLLIEMRLPFNPNKRDNGRKYLLLYIIRSIIIIIMITLVDIEDECSWKYLLLFHKRVVGMKIKESRYVRPSTYMYVCSTKSFLIEHIWD